MFGWTTALIYAAVHRMYFAHIDRHDTQDR